jgi:hypothetical protein
MITHRASKLSERCREYRRLQGDGNRVRQYVELREGLADTERRLAAPHSVAVTLRKEHVGEPPAIAHAVPLRKLAAEARAKFQGQHDALLDENQFPLREFRRRAEELGRQAERLLADVWDAHLDKVAPNVAEDLLALLGQFPQRQERVNRVRRLVAEVHAYRGQPPRDSDQFAQFTQQVEQLDKEWSALISSLGGKGESIPEAVRVFLQHATGGGGAPLEMATREVVAWLERANLASAFVVRTVSASASPVSVRRR